MAGEVVAQGVLELTVDISSAEVQAKANQIAESIKKALKTPTITPQINTKSIQAAEVAANKLNRSLSQVGRTQFASIVTSLKGTTGGIQSANKSAIQLGNTLQRVGKIGAAALLGIVGAGVKFAADIEQHNLALTALTGQLGATAEESTRRIQELANVTTLSFDTATSAVIKLSSAMGLTLDQSLALLKEIAAVGAVSSASSEQLLLAANALAQISARGKLSAQDLHQVSSALPAVSEAKVFEEIARLMGITTIAARELAEQGLVPSNVALQAIRTTMTQVPGAAAALEAQAGTLTNVFTTLADTIKRQLGTAILKAIEDAGGLEKVTKQVTDLVTLAIPKIGELAQALIEAAPTFVALAEAALPVVDVIADLIDKTGTFIDQIGAVQAQAEGKDSGGGWLGKILGFGGGAWSEDIMDFLGIPDFTKDVEEATQAGTGFNSTFLTPVVDLLKKGGTAAAAAGSAFVNMAEAASKSLKDTLSNLDALASANNSVTTAQQNAAKGLLDIQALQNKTLEFPRKLAQANQELEQANRKVAETTQHLTELEQELAATYADTASEAREIADAEQAVYEVRRQLQDLNEDRAATERELADLLRDAPEDLAAADRDVLRAKIALNEARREEQELLKATNREQQTGISLAGLSVDEIKNHLSNARAVLAAQRATTKTQKTQQQIEDEGLTVRLNVLDAEAAHTAAVRARTDLELDQGIKQRELNQDLADIDSDRAGIIRRQAEAVDALNKLLDGTTTRSETIKRLDGEITAAKRDQLVAIQGVEDAEEGIRDVEKDRLDLNVQIRDAKQKQKELEEGVRDAVQERKEAVAQILGDEREINNLLLERIKALPTRTVDEQNIQKQLLAGSIPTLLRGAVLVNASGQPIAGPPNITTQLVDTIVSQLLRSANSDILEALRIILRQAGLAVPGLAQGAIVNSETFARIGEAGREVVLPLSRPARLQELLANSQVLPPVLAALGKITLPAQRGAASTTPTLRIPNRGSGAGGQAERAARRQANDELATAIAAKLIEAGFNSGTAEGAININLTTAVQDPALIARHLKREVMRELDRLS